MTLAQIAAVLGVPAPEQADRKITGVNSLADATESEIGYLTLTSISSSLPSRGGRGHPAPQADGTARDPAR